MGTVGARHASFDLAAPLLNTGDILCWQGTGFVSRGIQAAQKVRFPWDFARISHVGMVLRPSDLEASPHERWSMVAKTLPHRLLTFESTTLNTTADILKWRPVSGVSIVPLRQKFEASKGRLFVKRLHDLPPEFFSLALEYIDRHHGKPYERKPWQLVASAAGFKRGLWGEDDSSLFCSELVIELLEYCGVIAEGQQDSDSICPAEVCQIGTRFKVQGGVTVSAMEEVKR